MSLVMTIVNYFLWFILYSVIGWTVETLLFAIRDRKSVKRGFLFGPLCPIYGTGAVICILVLYGRFTNFFTLFFAGLVLCTVIEYITHFVLEKVFHSMWWDYSNQKFNIKGRICLTSSLLFGLGVAVLLRYIHPFIESVTDRIPADARAIVAFIIYSVLILDVAITVESLKNVVSSLKEIQKYLIDNMQESIDRTDEKVEQLSTRVKSSEHIQKLVDRLKNDNPQVRKIRGMYPKLQMGQYKEALEIIFSRSSDDRQKERKADDNKTNDSETVSGGENKEENIITDKKKSNKKRKK